jgi:hypothetical protein
LGGSQTDIAELTAEDIDWKDHTISYQRRKTGVPVIITFGAEAGRVLETASEVWPVVPAHGADQRKPPRQDVHQTAQDSGDYRHFHAQLPLRLGGTGQDGRECPNGSPSRRLGTVPRRLRGPIPKRPRVIVPSLEDYESGSRSSTNPTAISPVAPRCIAERVFSRMSILWLAHLCSQSITANKPNIIGMLTLGETFAGSNHRPKIKPSIIENTAITKMLNNQTFRPFATA